MWSCCVHLRQFAGKAMLLTWSLSQVVAIGGSVCGVVWDQQQLEEGERKSCVATCWQKLAVSSERHTL